MHILFHKYTSKLIKLIIIILFSASLWQLASAGWIQGKAIIAQQLLNYSWNQALDDLSNDIKPKPHIPWPWADTWPVAKLIVPQHHVEQIVLAGDSGSSLAFGPGHSFASATPNSTGTTVISAHRDTHFQFLKDIKINETFYLQTADKTTRYHVYDLQVVDSRTYTIQANNDNQTLVLVTCYPFDALTAGGSLRYLVFAMKTSLV